VNLFDLVVVVLVAVAMLIGFRSGALPQVSGLIGAVGGGVVAVLALPYFESSLEGLEPQLRAFAVLAGILFAVGIGEAVGSAIGRSAAAMLGQGVFGTLDRLFGAVVGATQALLVIWLTGGLLAAGPSPTLASQAQTSWVVRGLSSVLPPPTAIAGELATLLNDTGLPELFVGLEPLPAPPVDLPDDPLVQELAGRSTGSVVKVTASTCLSISTGTGFVVAPGYVVTNAHVIAGATAVKVLRDDDLYDAVPVFIDPDLDIALVFAGRLPAPPLDFATTDPERGDAGAIFGFPGGRGLEVVPAAVADSYNATGRDIYGESHVTRSILELRAQIEQGDSGGPLILEDGSVGGVVFAEARTDDEVGYALTPSAVERAIAGSIGATGLADTGSCIH
jgi:S1-C subfamily serine protease